MKIQDASLYFWEDNPFDYDVLHMGECKSNFSFGDSPEHSGRNSAYSLSGECEHHFRSVKALREWAKETYGANFILASQDIPNKVQEKLYNRATMEQRLCDYAWHKDSGILKFAKSLGENWVDIIHSYNYGKKKLWKKEHDEKLKSFVSSLDTSTTENKRLVDWMRSGHYEYELWDDEFEDTDKYYLLSAYWSNLVNLSDDIQACLEY